MKIDLSCFHSGCTLGKHRVSFEIPKVCGVLDCTREVKTKILIGYTFYEVCFLHAQGFEEVIMENKDYEVSDN